MTGGVAAVQASAGRAKAAAGGAFERLVARLQDLLPRRRTAYRRVTPLPPRRETQRRAAVAVLALVVVVGGLGLARLRVRRPGEPGGRSARSTPAQAALETAQDEPRPRSSGRASTSSTATRARRMTPDRGLPRSSTRPRRRRSARPTSTRCGPQVVGRPRPALRRRAGRLDDAHHVQAGSEARRSTSAMVLGPDGVPVRPRPRDEDRLPDRPQGRRRRRVVVRAGHEGRAARPRRDAEAPRARRPRPADPRREERPVALAAGRRRGQGHADQGHGQRRQPWGDDIRAIGTFLRDASRGLYNLYVVDPSEQQILAYSPAADGSGFPAGPTGWLATARAVDEIDVLYIDGDIFVDRGRRARALRRAGKSDGWEADAPGDDAAPHRARRTPDRPSATDKRTGVVYAYDRRTPGSSPSTRRTATTWSSTGSPAAPGLGGPARHVRGPRAPTKRRRRSSGRRRTASTRPSSRPVPTTAPAAARRRAVARARSRAPSRPRSRPRSRDRRGRRDPAARRQPDAPDADRHDRASSSPASSPSPTSWACSRRGGETRARGVLHALGRRPGRADGGVGARRLLRRRRRSRSSPACSSTAAGCTSLGNLLYLWIFGNNIEDRLGRLGVPALLPRRRRRAGAHPGRHRPDLDVPTVGASGAIAATLGAYLVLFPRRPDPVARVPRLLLPADRRAGGHRARASGSCSS